MEIENKIISIVKKIHKLKNDTQRRIKQRSKLTYSIYCRMFCAVDDEDFKTLEDIYKKEIKIERELVRRLIIYTKIVKRKFTYKIKNNYLLLKDIVTKKTLYRKKIYF